MKEMLFVLLSVVGLLTGEWFYRSFFRPIDALSPQVLALSAYLGKHGVDVTPQAVQHGYRHSQVSSVASLTIKNFPLVISVDTCPNEETARSLYERIKASPNLTHPQRNGKLVVYLPMWGSDTEQMATRIDSAVSSFRYEPTR